MPQPRSRKAAGDHPRIWQRRVHDSRLLSELGVTIVGVSDSQGAIYNPDGIDPIALAKYKAETGSVKGFPGCQQVDGDALLEMPCDILVPATLENVITGSNDAEDSTADHRGGGQWPDHSRGG